MSIIPSATDLILTATRSLDEWEVSFGPFERHPSLAVDPDALGEALDEYLTRLTAPTTSSQPGNYPFFHPRYAGQMLKPPHPVALAAYAAAARINPNNHALDGGPPTAEMEKEVIRDLAAMFGFPAGTLGHLTGGGTMANLEALFIAREETDGRAIAVSADAHYTHARMAHVLGVDCVSVPTDASSRMDLDALEEALRSGDIGTVVLTAATTGLGVVDPIEQAIPLARRYGARVHVDAAYGGFFALLAHGDHAPSGFPAADFRAIADADSVVVDPHKHGLQPYGCGAVLLRDPAVGRHYAHDSPYTYFTSADLHLGEISLECSRPGAAAGALWLTLRVLPLRADRGLGPILAAGLRAARELAERLDASEHFVTIQPPETDIVVYAPVSATMSDLDRQSASIFDRGMSDPDDPLFLSLYRLPTDRVRRALPEINADADHARVLRSVLMKPEHEASVGWMADRLDALAK